MPKTGLRRERDPSTHPYTRIGRRLAASRKALELDAVEICRAGNIAQNTYSQWESGRSRPNIDDATRICDRYGLTLDWLFRGDISGVRTALADKILRNLEEDESAGPVRDTEFV